MHTLRTRFAKDIIAEFLPPARSVKKQRVIIIGNGAPTVPSKKSILEFFSKKGFWVFHFRYRGSWESDGVFLKNSPTQDVLDIVNQLRKGFKDIWNNRHYKLNPDQIIVLSSSFGGPAGILSTKSSKINKVIAISPVIDWRYPGPDEPYPKLIKYFEQGFGHAYRFAKDGWKKLQSGKFYNPITATDQIDGSKILIIHAKDDRTCPYKFAKQFAEETNSKLITLPKGDHMGTSIIVKPRFYKIFQNFIKN